MASKSFNFNVSRSIFDKMFDEMRRDRKKYKNKHGQPIEWNFHQFTHERRKQNRLRAGAGTACRCAFSAKCLLYLFFFCFFFCQRKMRKKGLSPQHLACTWRRILFPLHRKHVPPPPTESAHFSLDFVAIVVITFVVRCFSPISSILWTTNVGLCLGHSVSVNIRNIK